VRELFGELMGHRDERRRSCQTSSILCAGRKVARGARRLLPARSHLLRRPFAHLGYFRDEFVVRWRWLDDRTYADLVALCQFLPGPASSQVGIAIGLSRAGYPGALAAWTGFTLPSAIALVVFAYGVNAVAMSAAQAGCMG
jgi:hypothetical protein